MKLHKISPAAEYSIEAINGLVYCKSALVHSKFKPKKPTNDKDFKLDISLFNEKTGTLGIIIGFHSPRPILCEEEEERNSFKKYRAYDKKTLCPCDKCISLRAIKGTSGRDVIYGETATFHDKACRNLEDYYAAKLNRNKPDWLIFLNILEQPGITIYNTKGKSFKDAPRSTGATALLENKVSDAITAHGLNNLTINLIIAAWDINGGRFDDFNAWKNDSINYLSINHKEHSLFTERKPASRNSNMRCAHIGCKSFMANSARILPVIEMAQYK